MPQERSLLTRRQSLVVGAGATIGSVTLPLEWFRSPPRRITTIEPGAWPMQRHDPAHTGYVPNVTGPTRAPEVAWQATLSDESEYLTRAWLVSSGETVYVTFDHTLLAFDAATGERRWQTSRLGTLPWSDEPLSVETAPVLGAQRLLVGSMGSLYAVDRTDGSVQWEYKTNSSLDETLRAGNTVYVSSGIEAGDRLAALDIASGLERWTTRPDTGVHPNAYAEGYVVGPVIGRDGAFGAVDASSGTMEWTRELQLADAYRNGPCITNETIYYGTALLHALNLADGSTRWTHSLEIGDAELKPVSDGATVYLAIGETGRVLALDANSGDQRWSTDVRGIAAGSASALTDETLYVGLEQGIVALDGSSGEELFRVTRPGIANLTNSPIVAGGMLYLVLGQTLYAFLGQ